MLRRYEDVRYFQIILTSPDGLVRVSPTCPQQVVRVHRISRIWRTTRQKDKRVAVPKQTAGRRCYEEVVPSAMDHVSHVVLSQLAQM